MAENPAFRHYRPYGDSHHAWNHLVHEVMTHKKKLPHLE